MKGLSKLKIGCSGWSYPQDWKDIFYHSSSSLLRQYLSYFKTAEVNSTFYALPKPAFVKHLASIEDSDISFTAKIPQAVTHDNRLDLSTEAGTVLHEFFNLLKPIQNKIAALLIQLPPWDISNMGNLETFLSALDSSFRYAIEFRHESWLTQKVWTLLEDFGIAHVIVDEPKLPIDLRITTDFSYIRWHGHGTEIWYKYLYSIEALQDWRPRLLDVMDRTETVFGYFNNHFYGYAPFNALQMLEMMNLINSKQKKKLERMGKQFSQEQTTLDQF